MTFDKNSELILNVCLLQIRSVDDVVNIPALQTIYHTPSKITLTNQSENTESGGLHKKRITLNYPGLSSLDFDNFNSLIKGNYQAFVKLDNNDIYEVASSFFPLECATTFDIKEGHALIFSGGSPFPIKYRDNQSDPGINVSGFDYTFDFYVS